jgi:hypothetical protein
MGEGKRISATIRLREYREDRGLTQFEAAVTIQRFARARGDPVEPGLDQTALSRHENGYRRPSLYYQALYSEFYGSARPNSDSASRAPARTVTMRTWTDASS